MKPYYQSVRYKVALGIAFLDVILILITLIKRIPGLQFAFLIPFPQVLKVPGLWFKVAEICFYCSVLVALYCLISLWIPEVRFILWIGAGLVVGAGVLYLLGAVVYYWGEGMGVPVQQGIFMFLLSLAVPFLMLKLVRRYKRI